MKRYLKMIVSVTFVLITSITIYQSHYGVSKLDDLLLDNVEALAQDESDIKVGCIGIGSVDCPKNHTKVRFVLSGYSLE